MGKDCWLNLQGYKTSPVTSRDRLLQQCCREGKYPVSENPLISTRLKELHKTINGSGCGYGVDERMKNTLLLLLCFYFKTVRLRVGKSPASSLFALEVFLSPPVQAGMKRGKRSSFLDTVLAHSDFTHHRQGNVKKKVTFSTFSFCCSRMHSATSHYRPACQLWPARGRHAVTPWDRLSTLRMWG